MKTCIALTLAMAMIMACGPGEISLSGPTFATYPAALLDEIDEDLVKRAEKFLAEVRGTEMAPDWSLEAELDYEVRPLRRPDVNGVAYYEFGVTEGGFIVMATGQHDFAFPHWNFSGERPTDILLARADAHTPIQGFYKLDSVTYVAEDQSQGIASQLGKLPPRLPEEIGRFDSIYSTVIDVSPVDGQPTEDIQTQREIQTSNGAAWELSLEPEADLDNLAFQSWPTWKALKQGYAENYRPHLDRLLLDAQAARAEAGPNGMSTLRGAPSGNQQLLVARAWWVNLANDLRNNLNYYQFNCCGCKSGCGPTAWAIMMAHLSLQGQAGLSPCGERCWSGPVPTTNNGVVVSTVLSIRDSVGTYCLDGGGATSPWRMDDVSRYLNSHYVYYTLRTDYSLTGTRDSLRNHVIDTVVNKHRPSVIGTGFYKHYPVVAGYGLTWSGGKYFWVNQGWGGAGNGWISAATWFYGDVYTKGCIDFPEVDTNDGCAHGYRCCDPGPNDTCFLCISDSNQCP